jgi:hypothetical protein
MKAPDNVRTVSSEKHVFESGQKEMYPSMTLLSIFPQVPWSFKTDVNPFPVLTCSALLGGRSVYMHLRKAMSVFEHTVNTLVFPYADTIWQKATRPCTANGYPSVRNYTSITRLSYILAHVRTIIC